MADKRGTTAHLLAWALALAMTAACSNAPKLKSAGRTPTSSSATDAPHTDTSSTSSEPQSAQATPDDICTPGQTEDVSIFPKSIEESACPTPKAATRKCNQAGKWTWDFSEAAAMIAAGSIAPIKTSCAVATADEAAKACRLTVGVRGSTFLADGQSTYVFGYERAFVPMDQKCTVIAAPALTCSQSKMKFETIGNVQKVCRVASPGATTQCDVALTKCANGKITALAFTDADPSTATEAGCHARAQFHSDQCGNVDGTTTASFYSINQAELKSVVFKAVPTGCTINLPVCTNGKVKVTTVADNYMNSAASLEACMVRAQQYHTYCANAVAFAEDVQATYSQPGQTPVMTHYHGSTECQIHLHACTNNKVQPGLVFADSDAMAKVDATRCAARPREFSAYCGNRPGESVTSVFIPASSRTDGAGLDPRACFFTSPRPEACKYIPGGKVTTYIEGF